MSEVREVHQIYDDADVVNNGSGYAEQQRVVQRPPWSPTQFVVLIVGVVLIVFGGVALARTGIHFTNVPFTRTKVAGLGFTCLSAVVTIVAGVIVACCSAHPYAARTVGWLAGVVFIAFGLVVALAPTAFTNMWGFTTANGVALIICGAVLAVAAAVFPVLLGSSTSYARSGRTRTSRQAVTR
jgi:uncharacterized membrane protein HdeD (DUF308 family)